jgi:hypothetical protein
LIARAITVLNDSALLVKTNVARRLKAASKLINC